MDPLPSVAARAGRGIHMCGNPTAAPVTSPAARKRRRPKTVLGEFPSLFTEDSERFISSFFCIVRSPSVKKHLATRKQRITHHSRKGFGVTRCRLTLLHRTPRHLTFRTH